MMNTQLGIRFLVSAVTAYLLSACSSDRNELGRLPGGGGQAGADVAPGDDAGTADSLPLGTGGGQGTGGVVGSGGATGGTTGTGGGGGTTTSCPPVANCNWCGGQSLTDSRGCITGWRCANGIDPCRVSACSATSPCEAGKSCGADHLCWPGGVGGAGGATGTGGKGGGGAGGTGGSTGTPVRLCGSIGGIACQSGEFCELSAEACTIMDAFGVCSKVPSGCPNVYQPVCGCDGRTYDNDCLRQVARMSKIADGACGSTTGTDGGVNASSLSMNPASASFSAGIGLTSEPVTFVVSNHGSGASGQVNLILGGANPQPFIVSSNTCSAFLPAGFTCQAMVAFRAPSTAGTTSATLSLKESVGAVLTAPLSGYAFPPPGDKDAGAEDAATVTGCPESRPTSGSECNAAPNTWCSYLETGPTQIVCSCSSSRWTCAIASP